MATLRFDTGKIDQVTFDVLCGVEALDMKNTQFEFAAWVIGKYKESGRHLVEIKGVPKEIEGSIDVLEFVGKDLKVVDMSRRRNISGKKPHVSCNFLWVVLISFLVEKILLVIGKNQ